MNTTWFSISLDGSQGSWAPNQSILFSPPKTSMQGPWLQSLPLLPHGPPWHPTKAHGYHRASCLPHHPITTTDQRTLGRCHSSWQNRTGAVPGAMCWSPAQTCPRARFSAAPFSQQLWNKAVCVLQTTLFKAQLAPGWRGHYCFLKVNVSTKVQEELTHKWAVPGPAPVPAHLIKDQQTSCPQAGIPPHLPPLPGMGRPGPCPPWLCSPQAGVGTASPPVQHLRFHSTTCSSSRIPIPKKNHWNGLNKWSRLIISCREKGTGEHTCLSSHWNITNQSCLSLPGIFFFFPPYM